MNEQDARLLAGQLQDWVRIPSFVCEMIEDRLANGKYEEVCNFIVRRIKEEKGISDD